MLVVVAASFSTSARGVDQVTRISDGVTLRGEFAELGKESISIKLSNGKVEVVPVSDIRNVRFDQEPSLLAQAQSNERSGALDAALEKYKTVQADVGSGDRRVAAEVEFLIARTLVRQALAYPALHATARDAIAKFRNGSQSNFRYLESCLLEASVASAAGDMPAAETLLK